jgi:hypothetical protein
MCKFQTHKGWHDVLDNNINYILGPHLTA